MSEEYQESSEPSGDTSVAEESVSQAEPVEAEPQEAAPTPQEEKPAPFHEHPRFKELIDQNRSFKEQSEKYQQDLQRLQNEMQSLRQQAAPKPATPEDPFLRDLEKVNPEYAKSFKNLYQQAAKAEQLERQWQTYQAQQFQEKALSHFDSLLSTAKIQDPIDKELYRSAVEAEVYRREARGEKLGIKDLDKIFDGFHTKYSKYMDDRERGITAKYVSSKRSDAAPAPVTGGAATSPTAPKFASMDDPGMVKWLADQLRASKRQD